MLCWLLVPWRGTEAPVVLACLPKSILMDALTFCPSRASGVAEGHAFCHCVGSVLQEQVGVSGHEMSSFSRRSLVVRLGQYWVSRVVMMLAKRICVMHAM